LPAFLFFMLFIVALNMAGIVHIPRPDLQSALLLYKNYINTNPKGDGWYVGHIWSLSMEEQFYILWPPLLVACGLRFARKLALSMALLMPILRVAGYYTFYAHAHYKVTEVFHTTADRILWGCLLALYSGHPGFERIMSKLKSRLFFAGAVIFYFIADPLLMARWKGAFELPVGIALVAIAAAFAIAWLLRNPDSIIARFLNLKWMAVIGTLSYSLYLWQQPFMKPAGTGWFDLFPLNILCTVAGALLSYHLVEKTALRWKVRFRV
jgi:peptidoglycan/LPS O-acetylase OafA/YrhL